MSESNVNSMQSNQPTSDERLMAALAHGSVLLSFLGPIGPILIWISQRRKSAYASFHALQAMGYQMMFLWIGMAIGVAVAILWACLMIPLIASMEVNSSASEFTPLLFEGIFLLLMFTIWGIYFVGGILGAVRCLLKKDFRYPFLGKRLGSFLDYAPDAASPMDETKEDRWVAAMSHASAILLMWGLVSPLAVWITQKDRSPYLRFQALQATVYQVLALLAYFGFMAVYFFSMIALFLALPLTSSGGYRPGNESLIFLLIFGIVILVVWAVILLAVPTYHLFAMIAGIQILKGKDYHYPILGKQIERFLEK